MVTYLAWFTWCSAPADDNRQSGNRCGIDCTLSWAGIARENAMVAIAVGGVADHVHLLLSLPSTVPIAKAVPLLKSDSSKWIHENFPQSRGFSWQQGYGAFWLSISQQAKTVAYIHAQAKHHERVSS